MKFNYIVGIMLASLSLAAFGMDVPSSPKTGPKGSRSEIPPLNLAEVTHILVSFSKVVMPASFDGLSGLESVGASLFSLIGNSPEKAREDLFTALKGVQVPGFKKKHKKHPPVMHYWVTTKGSTEKARKIACDHISANYKVNLGFTSFLSPKGQLLYKIAESTFTPAEGIKVFSTPSTAAKIITALEHRLFACDNFGPDFWAALQGKHPDLFENFSGSHVSGTCGYLMDEEGFYISFLKAQQIKPRACLLIDTEPSHLATAAGLKLQTLEYVPEEGVSLKSVFGLSRSSSEEDLQTKVSKQDEDN